MRCRSIPLSKPRRFMQDFLALCSRIPTVPVQRRMKLDAVAAARIAAGRVGWPAVFLKAYGCVTQRTPALRRALVKLPWTQLIEYPASVANVAVERDYNGEPAVFFARIGDPASDTVVHLDEMIRGFSSCPIDEVKSFRKMLKLAGLPSILRRAGLWIGMNLPRMRAGQFGTFGLSVYSSLGAESLHPLSPLTTTLTYGVIGRDGEVDVRLIYDHRVLDGATVARALEALEMELRGPMLAELRAIAGRQPIRNAA
jgi:hypothetical protein